MGESTVTTEKNSINGGLMKSFFNNLQPLIILILIIVILLLQTCNGGKNDCPDCPDEKVKIKYVRDTVEVEKIVYKPKWRTKVVNNTVIDTVEVLIKTEVDTSEILKDYYSQYYYIDTLKIDTIGYVILKDTISMNSILKRSFVPKIEIPIVYLTNIEYKNKHEFYTGMTAKFNQREIGFMGVEGVMRNKKGNLFKVGIGVNQNQDPMLSTGVYWKFFEKE